MLLRVVASWDMLMLCNLNSILYFIWTIIMKLAFRCTSPTDFVKPYSQTWLLFFTTYCICVAHYGFLFMADIFKCHSRKIPGVINNSNQGCRQTRCSNFWAMDTAMSFPWQLSRPTCFIFYIFWLQYNSLQFKGTARLFCIFGLLNILFHYLIWQL